MKLLLLFTLLFCCCLNHAANTISEPISISMQRIPLRDALFALAKTLHKEALISDRITGNLTIDIKKLPAAQALTLIAKKYGLQWEEDNHIIVFTTEQEWVAQKEREIREKTLTLADTPLTLKIITLHYAKAADIVTLINKAKTENLLSKRGYIDADSRTNTILIHDTAQSIALIQRAITALDQPVKQILIETYLISMDRDNETALGIAFTDEPHGTLHASFPLAINKWHLTKPVDITLSLMEKKGLANILSSPRLFTADQETASIETGEEVPYQESSDNGGTTIAFKKAVLGLKMTPHILPGGRIALNIHINHDRPTNREVHGMPMITTRQITTNVILRNKETIILGGIYEQDTEHATSGIIGISELPIVGRLFKKNIEKQHKRELLIFVTPIIMNH